jgi:aminopeptidase N
MFGYRFNLAVRIRSAFRAWFARSASRASFASGATGAILILATVCVGVQGGEPFDDRSGADPADYPPSPLVDYEHIRLELSFRDLSDRAFDGRATFDVRAIVDGVRVLRLNAVDLLISSVVNESAKPIPNRPVQFDYDGDVLSIEFRDAIPTDRSLRFSVSYRCESPEEGMHFAVDDPARPDRSAQMHTLGQPESNRFWFPSHDFPNVRSTTETIVTLPAKYKVLSNGRLVSRTVDDDRVTYHWRCDQPHVAYLVSIVAGDFSVIEHEWNGIPVTYWVTPGREDDAQRAFARTPEMMTFLSDLLDEPYPYDQYAQSCVRQFRSGGMEHTSATTMHDQLPMDERAAIDHDQDGLIAHELAHQWFGDLITCRSWAHIWLNEGFATFMDELWLEHWRGTQWFEYHKWKKYRRVGERDIPSQPDALVWNKYEHPIETFRHKGSLPYGKGGSVLHMLRYELGDDVFFRGLAGYVDRWAYKAVETDDFRRSMEDTSGRNLEQFFHQWTQRPGVPQFDIRYTWDDDNSEAVVEIRQTQPISAEHPAFSVPLELYFRSGGKEYRQKVRIDGRKKVVRREFETRCDLFCVDPHAGVLKLVNTTKPRDLWVNQLSDGPTVPARSEAARMLSRDPRPEVLAALVTSAASRDEFWGVSAEALASLGRMQTESARRALLYLLDAGGPLRNPRVRRAGVEALGKFRHPSVTEALVRYATEDESYAVEAAATLALGSARRFEAYDVIVNNAKKESYRDQIRLAALEALDELADRRGLAVCRTYSSPTYHSRTRAVAIRSLANLARQAYETDRGLTRDARRDATHDADRNAEHNAGHDVDHDAGHDARQNAKREAGHDANRSTEPNDGRAVGRGRETAMAESYLKREAYLKVESYLVGLLSDEDPRVQDAAIRALGVLRTESALGALLSVVRGDAPKRVRRLASDVWHDSVSQSEEESTLRILRAELNRRARNAEALNRRTEAVGAAIGVFDLRADDNVDKSDNQGDG